MVLFYRQAGCFQETVQPRPHSRGGGGGGGGLSRSTFTERLLGSKNDDTMSNKSSVWLHFAQTDEEMSNVNFANSSLHIIAQQPTWHII